MVRLATASKSCKLKIWSIWGLTYSSGSVAPEDVWPTGTEAGGGADGSGSGGGGAARVPGLMGPRCLDGSRLSVMASGGWIGWEHEFDVHTVEKEVVYLVFLCGILSGILSNLSALPASDQIQATYKIISAPPGCSSKKSVTS
jgi:hypothetical protein